MVCGSCKDGGRGVGGVGQTICSLTCRFCSEEPSEELQVMVYLDGFLLGTTKTEIDRPDLQKVLPVLL